MNNKNTFKLKFKISKKTGCWNWIATISTRGYGVFHINGKDISAHRFSYELYKCQIPNGLFVCHHCDNLRCVNPSHLFVGNSKDNARDMVNKKRNYTTWKGEGNITNKLNVNQVKEIKFYLQNNNGNSRGLAKKYSINRQTIWKIKKNKIWKEVTV